MKYVWIILIGVILVAAIVVMLVLYFKKMSGGKSGNLKWKFDTSVEPPACLLEPCNSGDTCYDTQDDCENVNIGYFNCNSNFSCVRSNECPSPTTPGVKGGCYGTYDECKTPCKSGQIAYYSVDPITQKCVKNLDCSTSLYARSYCTTDQNCTGKPAMTFTKDYSTNLPSSATVWSQPPFVAVQPKGKQKLHFKPDGFNIVKKDHEDNMTVVVDPLTGVDHVLQVAYGTGSDCASCHPTLTTPGGGCTDDCKFGGQFWSNVISSAANQALLEFELYIPTANDPVLGGKLPGLYGGTPNSSDSCSICTGTDPSNGIDCWTARLMWRSGNGGEILTVIPVKRSDNLCGIDQSGPNNPFNDGIIMDYCENDICTPTACSPQFGCDIGRGGFIWPTGSWVKVGIYVQMNTATDLQNFKHDGIMQVSVNKVIVIQQTNVLYRFSPKLGVSGFVFSTFFGGSDPTVYAPTKPSYIYFKGFKVTSA